MHDISESASDNETDRPKHTSILNNSGAPKLRSRVSTSVERNTSTPLLLNGSRHSSFDESDNVKFHGPSFNTLERGRERERNSPFKDQYDQGYRKPPTGPQKPARSLDRRKTISRYFYINYFLSNDCFKSKMVIQRTGASSGQFGNRRRFKPTKPKICCLSSCHYNWCHSPTACTKL